MNKLLIIIGSTAVGKTKCSLRLAETFGGEIVSADSRLFYRGMDIGTAKPTASELSRVVHHFIDVVDPNQTVTLGQYQEMAYDTIEQIQSDRKLPILVGGTGQYVMAVAQGWGIPKVAPQPLIREQLAQLDALELNRWLKELDPEAAARIDYRNIRRVIRALEVTLVAGRPISELQRKTPPNYDMCWIGLYRERSILYQRIDQRVVRMIEKGLVEEVKRLRDEGYGRHLSSMSGLGYRQIYAYLDGEVSLDHAVERIKFETHRFARQQNTWFRQDDPNIHWFDLDSPDADEALIRLAQSWLEK